MAPKEPRRSASTVKPVPASAPPLNRTALIFFVAAYLFWLLFLIGVATGLIR